MSAQFVEYLTTELEIEGSNTVYAQQLEKMTDREKHDNV